MVSIVSIFRQFTIRTRMRGAIIMVLSLFGLVGVAGMFGGRELQEMNDAFMAQSLRNLGHVARTGKALDGMRLAERDLAIGYEENNRNFAQNRQRWDQHQGQARESLQALQLTPGNDTQALSQRLLTLLDDYSTAAHRVFKGLEANSYDTGGASIKAMRMAIEKSTLARENLIELELLLQQKAQRLHDEAANAMKVLGWAFGGLLAVVVVLVVPLTLINSSSITEPIAYAQTVAQAIAAGDLGGNIKVEGTDEASLMLASLREMQQSLTHLVSELRESSGTIHQASLEVATGSTDLSHRTEQSASNLQRTASSMVQLTQTVRQTADSAEEANRLAQSAAQVAQRGGDVVAKVVATMDDIHLSSRKIADIIGTIDSIAFQTNILALNAAVEAARAGDQGRGFAVVASEVRGLAQRSGAAAREIKQLIDNSVARVEDGSRLVNDAGATMTEIVSSVQKVSVVIGGITTSAREQSQGIVEVNGAITELDRMTQQNAALVEQSAAASAHLGEQAARLHEVVQRFQVSSA